MTAEESGDFRLDRHEAWQRQKAHGFDCRYQRARHEPGKCSWDSSNDASDRERGWTARSSVNDIILRDLKLKYFKKSNTQDLTEANKIKHLICAKQLLNRLPAHAVSFVWFINQKLFMVTQLVNLQNNQVHAQTGTKKKQVPTTRLLRTQPVNQGLK